MPLVELTAIIPDRPFDPKVFEREVARVLDNELREIYRLYKMCWRTWSGATPNMARMRVMGKDESYAEVYTADSGHGNEKLMWLDSGVPGRTITARRAPYLFFQSKFKAKTRRNVAGSMPGGKYGDQYTKKRQVDWHGIEARNFSETIARVRNKRFQQAVANAFDKAARSF